MMIFHVYSRDERGKPVASHELALDDIYFWTAEKTSTIVFTTKMGSFYKTAKFEELALLVRNKSEMIRTERAIMVNTNNIIQYDSQLGKVYFGGNIEACQWTYVASSRMPKLKSAVGLGKDIADKDSAIYSPRARRIFNTLFSFL